MLEVEEINVARFGFQVVDTTTGPLSELGESQGLSSIVNEVRPLQNLGFFFFFLL